MAMDRKRAIAMIDEYLLEPNSIEAEWVEILRMSRAALSGQKHGEWQYNTDDFTPKMRCSVCHYQKPLIAGERITQEPNFYCPNCGAKMHD